MNVIRSGLCSVTLRTEPIDQVARLVAECGLRGIEWGSDVHVRPGDAVAAARARAATVAADAVVASYGSYLFAAGPPADGEAEAVLATAVALGAPNIRVWAGFGVEPDSSACDGLIDGLRRFCMAAAGSSLTVGLEYHGGTPTTTVAGTVALLDAVGAPNLFTYWQPPYWRAPTAPGSDAAEVADLGRRLSHLHVYEWAGAEDRRPLVEGAGRWSEVLLATRAVAGEWSGDRYALLEFVPADDVAALHRDAAVLLGWLDEIEAR